MPKLHAVICSKLILAFGLLVMLNWWAVFALLIISIFFNLLMFVKLEELKVLPAVSFWLITLFPLTIFVGFNVLNLLSKK